MTVNWDKKLPETIIEYCHRCNDFIVTNDKAELSLFMFDHYGKDGIRLCTIPDTPVDVMPVDIPPDF